MEIVPALRLVRRTTRERRHPETEQHQLTTRRFDETAERSEAEIRSSFDRRDLRLRQPHRVREGLLGQPAHAEQLRQPDLVIAAAFARTAEVNAVSNPSTMAAVIEPSRRAGERRVNTEPPVTHSST